MFSKIFAPFVIVFIAYLNTSCGTQSKDENVAGVKHFYFEFVDEVQNEITIEIINEVSKHMVQYDYIMSEESAAKGWPFYGNVERGTRVLKTEMMPPHSNVNRLSPISKLTNYDDDEHILKVVYTIKAINELAINIDKKSYSWHNDEWQSFSQKMSTTFEIDTPKQEDLIDKISKTLIRYTFK
ncbi:MAG: hypothetical protein OEX22_01730 [Cyclobacteriaceae bacterium]|nr:hypothetical protein [Cyclobacteriaceae bacterium]